jgi:hypothetical protein
MTDPNKRDSDATLSGDAEDKKRSSLEAFDDANDESREELDDVFEDDPESHDEHEHGEHELAPLPDIRRGASRRGGPRARSSSSHSQRSARGSFSSQNAPIPQSLPQPRPSKRVGSFSSSKEHPSERTSSFSSALAPRFARRPRAFSAGAGAGGIVTAGGALPKSRPITPPGGVRERLPDLNFDMLDRTVSNKTFADAASLVNLPGLTRVETRTERRTRQRAGTVTTLASLGRVASILSARIDEKGGEFDKEEVEELVAVQVLDDGEEIEYPDGGKEVRTARELRLGPSLYPVLTRRPGLSSSAASAPRSARSGSPRPSARSRATTKNTC